MTSQKGLLRGRYKVTRELSRGGFGITYLAEDIQLSNSLCVIKKLDPLSADIETAKILFEREAHILFFLQQNQQIPKYFNYFEEGQNYYLVQEYIKGQSLEKLLALRWTDINVTHFLQEILLILKYLHQINIIHRDIKPSNVMRREEDGRYILIDFGSVKQLDPTHSGQQLPPQTMIGTPGYAPTEQMAGRPGFTSDIYGLGITAIHLLTGIYPTHLTRDEQDNVIFPQDVNLDNSLASLLKKMVYSTPDRRYQSVDKVLEHVNEIITKLERNATKQRGSVSSNPHPGGLLRLWHIPIILVALGAIIASIEIINPFIRPSYHVYQGNHLLDTYQPKKALEEFQNVLEIKPNSGEGWKGQGNALFVLGSDIRALESYNQALKLQPNDVKTLNNKGQVLYKIGRYQEALDSHDKVLKIDPNNAEALSGKGLAYLGLQQFEKATEYFEKLKAIIGPNMPRIWYDIALAREQLEGSQAAKKYYEVALEVADEYLKKKPTDPIVWTGRGNVLLKLNRPDDAIASYEKALEIDKNFYEALLGKANTLSGIKRRDEARAAYDQAIQVRPENYLVWYNRGILLARDFQDHNEALKSYEQAIKQRDDFYPAWLNKGTELLELKRYNEALVAFDKAKTLNSKDPIVYANRGFALEQLGRNQQACDSYKQGIQLGFPAQELDTAKVCK